MRSAKLVFCFSLSTDTWMTSNGHYSREKIYIDLQRLKASTTQRIYIIESIAEHNLTGFLQVALKSLIYCHLLSYFYTDSCLNCHSLFRSVVWFKFLLIFKYISRQRAWKGLGLLVIALIKTSSRFSCSSQWKTRSVGCFCEPEKQEDCNGVLLHLKVRKFS